MADATTSTAADHDDIVRAEAGPGASDAREVAAVYVRPVWLRRRDVARMLGLSVSAIEKMTYAGVLPVVRIGAAVRYRLCDVLAYAERIESEQIGDGRAAP